MKMNERTAEITNILKKKFGVPGTALHHKTPFELLVATILSAQCTDVRVNIVTGKLFQELYLPEHFAAADIKIIEEYVRSTGFYKNKAANIKKMSTILIERFSGTVPDNMQDLLMLPGVGRKTANVILGHIYGKPAVTVDTHVKRIAKKIGITESDKPEKIEKDIMNNVNEADWTLFSDLIILHGRSRCPARKPDCLNCEIKEYCDFGRNL